MTPRSVRPHARAAPGHRPQVALFIDTFNGWGRRLIRGILNFTDKHEAWDIDLMSGDDASARLPRDWDGDGIIARVHTPQMARWMKKADVPVVNVSGIRVVGCDLPRVTISLTATARLAADHFVERGYNRFAYLGPVRQPYVARHWAAFAEHVSSFAGTATRYDSTPLQNNIAAERLLRPLGQWLKGLAGPVGLFTWSIADALLVLRLCRRHDIAVPDDLALLAGDEDALACRISRPTLSGLVVASEQIGFRAAARLASMMNGRPDDGGAVEIEPIEIRTRHSTNALAIRDEQLRRAMHFMREHLHQLISIDQIADSVPVNRRSLERKFRAQFGTSPLEELLRLRLAKARQLLSLTELPISKIAGQCGFNSPTYMTSVFRDEQKMTPRQFRSKVRVR